MLNNINFSIHLTFFQEYIYYNIKLDYALGYLIEITNF